MSQSSFTEYADRFCFVPTISSLDISTGDLDYYNLGDLSAISTPSVLVDFGVPLSTYYKPTNSVIPYAAIAAPSTTTSTGGYWNTFHGLPSQGNIALVGIELVASSAAYAAIAYGLSIANADVNFGSNTSLGYTDLFATTGNVIRTNLTFTSRLLINGDVLTHFPTLDDPYREDYTDPNSSFLVSTTGQSCGGTPIIITMNNGSELILGSSADNRTGILNVNNGATVKLNYGSSVKLYNNSKIIIRKGSTLEIAENVNINLEDDNCVIEFEAGSSLKMWGVSTLSYTGNGFVRFRGGESGEFFDVEGPIRLSGNGKSDKVLELLSSPQLTPSSPLRNYVTLPNTTTLFEVVDGKIESNCEFTMGVSVKK